MCSATLLFSALTPCVVSGSEYRPHAVPSHVCPPNSIVRPGCGWTPLSQGPGDTADWNCTDLTSITSPDPSFHSPSPHPRSKCSVSECFREVLLALHLRLHVENRTLSQPPGCVCGPLLPGVVTPPAHLHPSVCSPPPRTGIRLGAPSARWTRTSSCPTSASVWTSRPSSCRSCLTRCLTARCPDTCSSTATGALLGAGAAVPRSGSGCGRVSVVGGGGGSSGNTRSLEHQGLPCFHSSC